MMPGLKVRRVLCLNGSAGVNALIQLVPSLLLDSQYASWNASGTHVAVTSSDHAKILVYDMIKRRLVRQALL